MTRPDDIPEWAWEKASDTCEMVPSGIGPASTVCVGDVARAILAAVEEEREGCAELSDQYASEHAAMAVDALDIKRPLDLATATKASFVASHIASAIRNRS